MIEDLLTSFGDKLAAITEAKTNNFSKVIFKEYKHVTSNLRATRRNLRSLAIKTKPACEDSEFYLENWDQIQMGSRNKQVIQSSCAFT